jgi:hypothetical protein
MPSSAAERPVPVFDPMMVTIDSNLVFLYGGNNQTSWSDAMADPWIIDLNDPLLPSWTHATTDPSRRPGTLLWHLSMSTRVVHGSMNGMMDDHWLID